MIKLMYNCIFVFIIIIISIVYSGCSTKSFKGQILNYPKQYKPNLIDIIYYSNTLGSEDTLQIPLIQSQEDNEITFIINEIDIKNRFNIDKYKPEDSLKFLVEYYIEPNLMVYKGCKSTADSLVDSSLVPIKDLLSINCDYISNRFSNLNINEGFTFQRIYTKYYGFTKIPLFNSNSNSILVIKLNQIPITNDTNCGCLSCTNFLKPDSTQ